MCTQEQIAPAMEELKMETMKLFTFVVRKGFGLYKDKQTCRASVRTYVKDLVEVQDFVMEDGTIHNCIPCENTKFTDKGEK